MTTAIWLKSSFFWDLNRSQYTETDVLPLMTSPVSLFMILATYLLFVLKVGPDLMRKREAFKLTSILLVYNAVQVLFSAYIVWFMLRILLVTGFIPTKCFMEDSTLRKDILFGTWLYFAAKVTELADTVMFVLRKKDNQVTFLHVYHHSIMMVGTWATLKYYPSETMMYIGFINSLVHVVMYSYYGLSALGPHVTKYLKWKRYITSFQLVQFITVIIQYVASLKTSECPPSKGISVYICANTILFLFLFADFYKQNYTKSKDIVKIGINGTTKYIEKSIKSQ